MKWMPETLHHRAGRAAGLAAALAAFAVAVPNAAMANDSDPLALSDAQPSRQVVANASAPSGTTKTTTASKNLRDSHIDRVEARIMDLHSKLKIAEAHAEGLKSFVPPFEALYDSMSDSQKKLADQTFRNSYSHSRIAGRAAAKGS